MAEYGFTVLFEQLEEGGYQVIVPALPGIVTNFVLALNLM